MSAPLVTIIDDDQGMRWAIDALVRSLGLKSSTHASAEAFLASDDIEIAACVISDVQMRGLSGIDLASRLRGPPHDRRLVPIILISAFADERMSKSASAAGAMVLLKKPFDPDVLVEHLERAVGHLAE